MEHDVSWMENERFHEAAVEATAKICIDWEADTLSKVDTAADVLYHFTAYWYAAVHKHNGALVVPVVETSAWFVNHMIDEHGLPAYARLPMLDMLIRYCSLVITKCGGRLV